MRLLSRRVVVSVGVVLGVVEPPVPIVSWAFEGLVVEPLVDPLVVESDGLFVAGSGELQAITAAVITAIKNARCFIKMILSGDQ